MRRRPVSRHLPPGGFDFIFRKTRRGAMADNEQAEGNAADAAEVAAPKGKLKLMIAAATHRYFSDLPARAAGERSQRLRGPVSAQGGTDPARQYRDLAKPGQRGAVQGNRHSVTGRI